MSLVPFIFASESEPDIVLGKIGEISFPIPDEVALTTQIRNFEVWNSNISSFNFYDSGTVLEINSSGVTVTGDAQINGNIFVSDSVEVEQTVTANIVCANFLCDIPFTTLSSFVNNPYLAGIADGSISPPDGEGGGGGGTGFTGSVGFTGSQGVIGFTGSSGTGGGSSVTISSTVPETATPGDLWWNNVEGQLKIYYDDGDTIQWVDSSSGAIGATGFTGSAGTAITSSDNLQINSLGVGTSATGTLGEIVATGEITAYFSDLRLKNIHGKIENAIEKVQKLNGYYYTPNDIAQQYGYNEKMNVGVSAQEVQSVLPEIVVPAPIDNKYLTVHYEKLVPLLIEAIKELSTEIEKLKQTKNAKY